MKVIGQTPQGGSIVEFSEKETGLLIDLQSAMDGQSWQPKVPRNFPIDGNMEKAFLAVIWFIEAKFSINNLRSLVDEMNEAIGVK